MRLDPHPGAAGAARRAVAAALPGADQEATRDAAMLLVSELVTNAIVHAASGVELEIDVTPEGVTVRVRDADTGPLVMRNRGGSELDEGGRGFLLVDRLADAWGTEHHGGRKTVWFRVGPSPAGTAQPAPVPVAGNVVDFAPELRRLVLAPPLAAPMSVDEQLGELLMRVTETVAASGAELKMTAGGASTPIGAGDCTPPVIGNFELTVAERGLGMLVVHGHDALSADAAAFAALAADRLALLVAEHGLIDAQSSRVAELDFLAEATELLSRSLNVALSLTLVTQIVVPRFGSWCAAFRVDDRGRPRRLTVNHRNEERVDDVVGLLEEDAEVRQAVRDAAKGAGAVRLPGTVFVAGKRHHVTVVPMQSHERTLGVLVIGRDDAMNAMLYMGALELARRAALSIDNARLHEEQVATVNALQASLLPGDLPVVPRIQLAARYHSASPGISVGGDFYDAFRLADGRLAVAIGDVCGKGAEAAVVTGMTRDLLRVLMHDGETPAGALYRLNRALLEHPTASRFCTVALALLSPGEERTTARLCLAGHPEPVLLHPDGSSDLVGVPGGLLGVLEDDMLDLVEVDVVLDAGSAMVFYTDGVTERRDNGRMFGQFGVRQALASVADRDADAVAGELEDAARSYVDTALRDDLAILVVRQIGD